jgi:adenylate kinase family enzyme
MAVFYKKIKSYSERQNDMAINDIVKDNIINGLSDEEIEFLRRRNEKIWYDDIASIKAYITAAEEIKADNPIFNGKTLIQLNDDDDFQRALKEYRELHPSLIPFPEPEKIREVLKSILPKIHFRPNTKLSNQIKNIVNEGETEVIINGNKSKNEVVTKVMLNYENKNVHLVSNLKFTAYDREVYDGVITLYEAGNNVITPIMVYRAMNGLTETERISDKAVEEVRESLDKSSRIRTVIDYTDEAKLYNKKIDKTTYEGYLLSCVKITVEAGGKEVEAYRLLDKPFLYAYAQVSGQIISVPINLLNTRDTVNSTEDVIVIRGYLLRQIEWMRYEKSIRSPNITYQGIYDELDITRDFYNEPPYIKKTAKIRGHVKSILESWQTQNYISSFKEYKDGKQIKGVKIYLQV